MSKLYIARGACSFGTHVAVRELGLPVELVKVKLREPGSLIYQVNPLGRVPALQLDDGALITESTAILQYLADQVPGTPLFAPAGSIERGQIQSWLSYIGTEIHVGSFRAINRPERYHPDPAEHTLVRERGAVQLKAGLSHIEKHLTGRQWLVGERFTIADAYLGVFIGWLARLGPEFADSAVLNGYREAYRARPSVQAALAFEQD
ncbi:glutathione S-transferase [Andreprevotia lacus DSM 23236]|jgi:glutathione S-transferase|uniref:Glutathione S-transferase n=1 Tax=Andreprevotia lacus DSM 23236 TaxID=1121001 RepID=A0A1W1XWT0_9NEIS|nr:glutathione S-transferase N-terminal domain-containing protein [Andreprevotia lacus]SMC28386.1 glutathione S-transferase [Andreprevotia lacus DSM 23236]